MNSLHLVDPINGCHAISSGGVCYSYFTSLGITWEDARLQCVSRGYDLATITSVEENTLMYSTLTAGSNCWIGLNDIESEGTFVWADRSDSTFRFWASGQPNDDQSNQDCVETYGNLSWNDLPCNYTVTCYFCSKVGELQFFQTIVYRQSSPYVVYTIRRKYFVTCLMLVDHSLDSWSRSHYNTLMEFFH